MQYLKFIFINCTCIFLLTNCKNKPVVEKTTTEQRKDSVISIDTAQIDKRIRQKEKSVFTTYSDTARTPSIKDKPATYYLITNFYYDSSTRDLFKAENILVSANKSVFTGYFDAGEVVKTIANTDMGRYVDYFRLKENPQQNNFRSQCFLLAKNQLSIFNDKLRK
jgi:hypothetical protein